MLNTIIVLLFFALTIKFYSWRTVKNTFLFKDFKNPLLRPYVIVGGLVIWSYLIIGLIFIVF